MTEQQTTLMLAKWAEIFREEGDTETADAIKLQLERSERANLTDPDKKLLRYFLAKATKYEDNSDCDLAVRYYAKAVRVVEATFGAGHPETFDRLSDLARCHYQARQYEAALEVYSRLLRLAEDRYGPEDRLISIGQSYIRYCRKGIRERASTLQLGSHLNGMLRHSQGRQLVEDAARADRMRDLGRRLAARGRRDAAVRLHTAAIALRLCDVQPDSEIAYLEIQRHAMDLKEAGEAGKAAMVLNKLAAMRNLKSGWSEQGPDLQAVLLDSAACLRADGKQRSAQEAAALADLISRRGEGDDALELA